MSLRRIARSMSVVAAAGVLAGSSYAAGASTSSLPPDGSHRLVHGTRFAAPVPHKYGANGMRMGLHCETVDIS